VLYPVHIETALVRVRLDDGSYGWGEAQAPLAPEVACTIIEKLLRPALEGEEFQSTQEEIARLWDRMYASMRVRGHTGGFMLDAISGVDMALWDLAGKLTGQSVAAMLGDGNFKPWIPAYLSGVAGGSIDYARGYYDAGFRTCKLYFESDWGALLKQMDGLHAAFGADFRIAVDALWHMDPGTAIADARELDARGALWLECPLMPENAEAHEELSRAIRTKLALGESYRTCHELAPFFSRGVMHYVQPDLGRSGLTEGMRIAKRAAESGMEIVPHVSIAFGPQIAAALHYAAAVANCAICEYNPRVLEVANRYLKSPLRIEGATYLLPEEPGLGIELDEAAIIR
jgi:galactonate dehydratase